MRTLVLRSLFLLGVLLTGFARAEQSPTATMPYDVAIDAHPYSQTLSIEVGSFHPQSISISNSDQRFDYSSHQLDSYAVEPQWSVKIFHFLGAFSISEGLPISLFSGTLSTGGSSVSLFTLGADTRLKYSMEWLPLTWIIPFLEAGYQYTLYRQSGETDLESVVGSTGNWAIGAGIDLWVNGVFNNGADRVEHGSTPIFLTVKFNRLLPSASNVNLGYSSLVLGFGLGI